RRSQGEEAGVEPFAEPEVRFAGGVRGEDRRREALRPRRDELADPAVQGGGPRRGRRGAGRRRAARAHEDAAVRAVAGGGLLVGGAAAVSRRGGRKSGEAGRARGDE